MKKILILAAMLFLFTCCEQQRPKGSCAAASISSCLSGSNSDSVMLKVSRVIDGDTFEGNFVTDESGCAGGFWMWRAQAVIRISGIDAPERGQYYGDVAMLHLDWLLRGKTVVLLMGDRDQYGRWIATTYVDGIDVGAEMLKEGLAWHYVKYDSNRAYAQLEARAKQFGQGLWSDDQAIAPWKWRTMSKYERDAYR